jgi:hypothetical protein
MDITVGTPALLFPAISLTMLAYTTRFLALTNLIRQLREVYSREQNHNIIAQIRSLRLRVRLVLWMQGVGIVSFSCCVAAMLALLLQATTIGLWCFGASLGFMLVSLLLSMLELRLSADALDLALKDISDA